MEHVHLNFTEEDTDMCGLKSSRPAFARKQLDRSPQLWRGQIKIICVSAQAG